MGFQDAGLTSEAGAAFQTSRRCDGVAVARLVQRR
jgi:hypothetical protein